MLRDVGVEIVKAAVVYGNRLSGNAYKVLVVMSLSALDRPNKGRPACLYWGGWDALAMALGHADAERGGSGHTVVARAIRELRNGRHITPMVDAGRGTRQSYMVHPGGIGTSAQGEQSVHPKGEQNVHAKGEQIVLERVNKVSTPRKEQGPKGLNQDTSLTVEPKPQTARGEKPNGHKFQGRPGDDCDDCGIAYTDRRAHPLHLLRGHA